MVKFFSLGVALLGLLVSAACPTTEAYPNPRACTGVCGNAHDPAIMRRGDGTYFRFSTNGKVAIHTAPAITGPWVYKGAAIPAGSKINLPGRDGLWAPDVQKIGDTYYLYYSVSTFGSQTSAIGVATSKTMDVGSWTDHGSVGIASDKTKPYNAIDPNLIVDGTNHYLVFGSFWKDIYQVKMSSPLLKSSSASHQIAYDQAFDSIEGAYVFKHGHFFYLFYSQGQCCAFDKGLPAKGKEYKIKVCRSSSATTGYVDKNGKSCTSGGGTVVLESHGTVYAPGGQGVYQDKVNGPIIYYHYVDTKRGYHDGDKLFGWNKLNFATGWPVAT